VARVVGLTLGLLAFLRAPFDDGATRRGGRWWTPAEPAAQASIVFAEEATPEPVRDAPARSGPRADAVASAAPYMYFGEADVQLHPVRFDGEESLGRLIEDRLATLEDFGDTAAGRDVLFLLGAEHQVVADFARAASFYEAYASHPRAEVCTDGGETCTSAAAALENAMLFRRASGQTEEALADADLYARRYASSDPRGATRVALAAAALSSDDARVDRLRALSRRRLPPAEAIQVDVELGEVLWDVDRDAARRAFRRADRLWERAGGAQMARSPGLDSHAWVAELGRTRESLAEARFREAERRYHVAKGLQPPSYSGPSTERHAQRWVVRRLRPWMERRLRRVRLAERALARVDVLGLTRWTVAAAARRGQLYQDLADAVRTMELPEVLAPEDPEGDGVRQYREPIREHLVEPAIARFQACMDFARQTRAYGEWSDRCADALGRYEPRYRRSAELRPETPLTASRLARPW